MIEQRVTLRYDAQQIPAVVQAVQGDTGRDVIFELADYEIPAGATANYYIDKPDGNAVYNSAEVISSTEILAHLTGQALAVPGRNNGQVRILSDGEVITSFDFVLEVEAFRGILRLQSETEVNVFDEALQAAAEDAIQEILDQTPVVTGMQNSIAPTYSSSSTYAVGDYVMYNAQLYRCITAITTAEAWTADHWKQVPLANDIKADLSEINERFDNIREEFEDTLPTATLNLFNPETVTPGKWVNETTGVISDNANYVLSDYIRVEPNHQYKTPTRFGFAGYDKDYNFIACSISSGVITTASDVVWLRVSLQASQLDVMYVADGNVIASTDFYRGIDIKGIPASVKKEISILDEYYDRSANLFNYDGITTGYFINDANGNVTASANYCYSDYIKVKENTVYTVKNGLFGGGCYDQNMNFIPWSLSNKTITTPSGAQYMRLSMLTANATGQWCIEGTGTGSAEYYDVLKPEHIPQITTDKLSTPQFDIILPSNIYLIKDSDFSIYFKSIVYPFELFDDKRYAVVVKTSANTVKGETYSYKWHYKPTTAGETFTMVFSIRDMFTNADVCTKNVQFTVSTAKTSQTKNVILMGDSFMDGYGISGYTYGNIIDSGNSLNVLGVNSANSAQYPNLKDNAWAGQGYRWVTGGYSWSAYGGLRSDRPLSDAYWDEGWGEGEPNGWTAGQTYSDLTPTQRSHGHTKNEFYNPSTNTFDLTYYLTTYQNGATCDVLLSEYGLNDVGWIMTANEDPEWTIDNFVIPAMQKIITSAVATNANIKVVFCLIPPNDDDNNTIGSAYANGHNKITNRNIQMFNKKILEAFESNANVIIIPSNANFDDRYGYITGEYKPIKFDNAITETHTTDIHPSVNGAKFYADSMTNVLYYLL